MWVKSSQRLPCASEPLTIPKHMVLPLITRT